MKKILPIIIGFLLYLMSPLSVLAVNVTVPQSTALGQVLLSTTTGAWVATTTNPLTAGAYTATSTTRASIFPYASTTALTITGAGYIPQLANLTSNGFVKTGSGNGTLSVDTNTYLTGSGAGVTAVSVASSNGFTGSSSGGATPQLTLTTSISGVLKGNGTAISAAANGTDYTLTTAISCSAGNHLSAFTAAGVGTCSADTGSAGNWATTSQDYYNSQFRDWSINSFGALVPTTTRGFFVSASSTVNANFLVAATSTASTFNATSTTGTSTFQGVVSIDAGAGGPSGTCWLCVGTSTSNPSLIVDKNSGRVGIGTKDITSFNANTRLIVTGVGSSVSVVGSTTDSALNSAFVYDAYAAGARVFMGAHDSGQVVSRYGITLGGWGEIGAFNSNFGTVNGLIIGTATAVPIVFGTLNADRGRFDGAGNFGIATTAPLARLSVGGSAYIGGNLTATGTIQFSNLTTGCATLGATGILTSTGVTCGTATGSWATTSQDYYNSQFRDFSLQGSPLYLAPTTSRSFLINNGTSTITNLQIVNGTTTNATSTNSLISGNADFGATGVRVTNDGDGALTFLGMGDGNDENLIINFDDGSPANTISLFTTTGVTSLNFIGMGLISTGDNNSGIGTTSPWAQFSVGNHNGGTEPVFVVASSSVALATSTYFIVGPTGNVGIGTTSPYAPLSVIGTIVADRVTATSTDSNSSFGADLWPNRDSFTDNTGFAMNLDRGFLQGLFSEVNGRIVSLGNNVPQLGNRDTGNIGGIFRLDKSDPYFSVLHYATGGNVPVTDLAIDSTGRVGIGNASPSFKLDVNGAINAAGNITGTNIQAGTGNYMGFGAGNVYGWAPADGVLELTNSSINGFTRLQLGGTTSNFPAIGRTGSSTYIGMADGTAQGQLGVGTSTPNWTLQAASTTPYLAITDTDAGTNAKHWIMSAIDGKFRIGTSSDALSATSTYFTIASGGNVGIGTTSPYKTLSVNGDLVADNFIETINYNLDNSGSVISTTGSSSIVWREVQATSTIVGWTILGDLSGTVKVEIKKATYANYPNFTSIVAGAPPQLSSAIKNQGVLSDVSTWTTQLNTGDILQFSASGTPATVTKINMMLKIKRN